MKLRPPPRKHGRAVKSREYLPSEAQHINTPQEAKPTKGNKLISHCWKNVASGFEGLGPAANIDQQLMHTLFPMPTNRTGSATMSAPTTPYQRPGMRSGTRRALT
jgi:hypothetical protein